MDMVSLIDRLNIIGSSCGIGRTDCLEDRVIGIKSREIYEAPAAWTLYNAHKELEALTLDREALFFKEQISLKYSQLIYQGLWFTQLKQAFDAFIASTQKCVNGKIGLKLYKGNILITKRSSSSSRYKKEFATYGEGDKFDRTQAEGFIKLWAMPYRNKP
jgi:argininosuccinate synthase